MNMALSLDPILVGHCLELAEEYLKDTRPIAPVPDEVVVPFAQRAWFVLQTVIQGEEKVAIALRALGFDTYVPMMRKDVFNRRQRRVVTREFKLFNRYMFAHLPVATLQWRTVEAIEEIDCVLGAAGVPCPVADSEIARFRAAEAARQFDVTKAERFPIGSRVRVLSGPFGGFAGLVESLPGRGVVKAMVEIFGRLAPVEFRYDMVEPD